MTDEEEICGHEYTTRDGICDNDPKYPDGKCGYHSDFNEDMERGEEWNPNMKHGINLDPSPYYRAQDDKDKQIIDAIADSFIERLSSGMKNAGNVEILRQVAVDLHKKRRADEYIEKQGMTQEKTVGVHEQYGEITQDEENVLHITADRLSRESRQRLKDLGVWEQEEASQEDAQSVIEQLSQMSEE